MILNSLVKNSLVKNTRLMFLAGFLGSTLPQMNAAPIEHIGDRYIMHVSEMELTGEESLLDVLMMCPGNQPRWQQHHRR